MFSQAAVTVLFQGSDDSIMTLGEIKEVFTDGCNRAVSGAVITISLL